MAYFVDQVENDFHARPHEDSPGGTVPKAWEAPEQDSHSRDRPRLPNI